MTAASDAELMRAVRSGASSALGALFERHHARLYRFCLRMVGDRHAAEDLVQEVFMRMLRFRKTFRDDSAFGLGLRMPNNSEWRGGFNLKQVEANFNPAMGFVSRSGRSPRRARSTWGSRRPARSMGPATSWGNQET